MKLVFGLGNPGSEYANTRHNIGFIMLDDYIGEYKWSKKFNGLYIEKNINGEKYVFVKPLSFMNLSGGVVSSFVNYYKVSYKDIIVIHDDLDLPFGKIRIKVNSSAGGHNGVKDIIKSLNTQEFMRIKVGISNNKNIDTKDYVLGNFSKSDLKIIKDIEKEVFEIIENFDYDNIDSLMNKYN
ncbi:MAG: aminoacyl-tRNA hydrolase [Bacilli bacterium]|nr:aminoacyl-tRNA hydrolase [Bacilli bacterium]